MARPGTFAKGQNGGGKGPPKGQGGRPPDEFKRICQGLASRDDTLKAATAILKNKNHPAWLGALKWATENGYGPPSQRVEHTGKGGGPIKFSLAIGDPEQNDERDRR